MDEGYPDIEISFLGLRGSYLRLCFAGSPVQYYVMSVMFGDLTVE